MAESPSHVSNFFNFVIVIDIGFKGSQFYSVYSVTISLQNSAIITEIVTTEKFVPVANASARRIIHPSGANAFDVRILSRWSVLGHRQHLKRTGSRIRTHRLP